MRVLHVINDLRVGGAETLVVDLCREMNSLGAHARIAALAPCDSFKSAQADAEGVLLRDNSPSGMRSPFQMRRLKNLADRFDIVHAHLFPAQLWTALAARPATSKRRVPALVATEHSTDNRRRHVAALRGLDAGMYRRYDRVICISVAVADALEQWIPSTRGRTTVIANGIEVERVANASPVERSSILGRTIAPGSVLVACVGSLEPQKNHDELLDALALLPDEWHGVLVGDGSLRSSLTDRARRLGILERVHFLGIRTDVASVLKACDIYAQPSSWEGFGIAAVEAMAAGLPVVVSDVPGLSDVVGEVGRLAPPDDASVLASQLLRTVSDVESASRRVAAGHRRARTFGVSTTAERHLRLYEEVLADTAGHSLSRLDAGPRRSGPNNAS